MSCSEFPSFQFSKFPFLYIHFFKFHICNSKLQIIKFLMLYFHFLISSWQISEFRVSTFQFSKFQNVGISICSIFKFSDLHLLKFHSFKQLGTRTFQHFQNFRFSDIKNIFSRMPPYIFLYSLKYFGDKCGVRGSIFGHILVVPKMSKSIAIDQDSLINHLGVIETLPPP